jgi:hypothetical protein
METEGVLLCSQEQATWLRKNSIGNSVSRKFIFILFSHLPLGILIAPLSFTDNIFT